MNPELDPRPLSQPRKPAGGTLRQQLLKMILPTTIIPLLVAGGIDWQITRQRSLDIIKDRTWNQAMLAADVSNEIAGTDGLKGKDEEVAMVLEHASLTPSTHVRILEAATKNVLASVKYSGADTTQQAPYPPEVESKITALMAEFKATQPKPTQKLKPGRQSGFISQRPALVGMKIQPFWHEEGFYAVSTDFRWQDKYYHIATVPGREWVGVATVNISESEAPERDSIQRFLALTIVLGGIAAAISSILARRMTQPLSSIAETVEMAAAGNLDVQAKLQGSVETQVLGQSFNTLISQVRDLLGQQAAETERSQALRDLSLQLSQATQAEAVTLAAVKSARDILKTDRVIVFEFDPSWKGTVVAESVGGDWTTTQGMQIEDPCFGKDYAARYQNGRISAISDIYTANLTACHLQELASVSVRANLVVPILVSGQLQALLIAHECEGAREWTQSDIELMGQVANQIGVNLERVTLLERTQTLADEQSTQRQNLQMGLLDLLSRVESAAQGDLTVRADVEGEVGTVGDFFNAILESLRTIVAQVKVSAEQVTVSVNENEMAIRQLANDAAQQAEEVGTTLGSIDRMTQSIHTVAANAQAAADVARSASSVAQSSSSAMDRAVSTILTLRETVTDTSLKMKRLGESSKQISKVVELINQFALETNMLAINAGIEAARAGEEGRGFAVVAQEVGALAAQSAGATKEIERIVSSIQRETDALVKAMQSSQVQVEEGTHLLEATKQGLGEIVDVSQRIDELVATISTETVEQVSTSESVAALMQQLNQVSERTSQASRQISTALQATVSITEQLQASVRTFKVTDEG
jgi:methyl-accepting chemotaxis protein PixJ